jgi:hypothetical protein
VWGHSCSEVRCKYHSHELQCPLQLVFNNIYFRQNTTTCVLTEINIINIFIIHTTGWTPSTAISFTEGKSDVHNLLHLPFYVHSLVL